MGDGAVDDDGSFDIASDRLGAGFHFGNHAATDNPFFDQIFRILKGQFLKNILIFIKHARHIGQKKKPGGPDRGRNGTGGGIGIDVIGLPIGPNADGRDDRNNI